MSEHKSWKGKASHARAKEATLAAAVRKTGSSDTQTRPMLSGSRLQQMFQKIKLCRYSQHILRPFRKTGFTSYNSRLNVAVVEKQPLEQCGQTTKP